MQERLKIRISTKRHIFSPILEIRIVSEDSSESIIPLLLMNAISIIDLASIFQGQPSTKEYKYRTKKSNLTVHFTLVFESKKDIFRFENLLNMIFYSP